MKFLHTADIHLDSPLRGLDRYEGAPVDSMRLATRQALRNLIDFAIQENVQFIVIAGDLYDGNWKDYNTGLFFSQCMSRLREADIEVVIIAGNHDAASQLSRNLQMPSNVHLLSDQEPETLIFEKWGVALHGQSFPKPAVSEDITLHYPSALPDLLNIGLLHTCVTGREGHDPYAPCSVEGLCSKGYQYWALGHVHQREVLHEKESMILFSGNLQGRHIRETGDKGATLVCFEGQELQSCTHVPFDVLRWYHQTIDVSDSIHPYDALEHLKPSLEKLIHAAEGRSIAARIELQGTCQAHPLLIQHPENWIEEIRNLANDVSSGQIWLEKVVLNTALPLNKESLLAEDGPLAHVIKSFESLELDNGLPELWEQDLKELKRKIPHELQHPPYSLELENPDFLKKVLENAKQRVLAMTS